MIADLISHQFLFSS